MVQVKLEMKILSSMATVIVIVFFLATLLPASYAVDAKTCTPYFPKTILVTLNNETIIRANKQTYLNATVTYYQAAGSIVSISAVRFNGRTLKTNETVHFGSISFGKLKWYDLITVWPGERLVLHAGQFSSWHWIPNPSIIAIKWNCPQFDQKTI
jgi:hypothetical protein